MYSFIKNLNKNLNKDKLTILIAPGYESIFYILDFSNSSSKKLSKSFNASTKKELIQKLYKILYLNYNIKLE